MHQTSLFMAGGDRVIIQLEPSSEGTLWVKKNFRTMKSILTVGKSYVWNSSCMSMNCIESAASIHTYIHSDTKLYYSAVCMHMWAVVIIEFFLPHSCVLAVKGILYYIRSIRSPSQKERSQQLDFRTANILLDNGMHERCIMLSLQVIGLWILIELSVACRTVLMCSLSIKSGKACTI